MFGEINVPVAVVGIGGQYRTGKSYLFDILKHGLKSESGTTVSTNGEAGESEGVEAQPSTSGFGIGHSVQACTKGIWLWGEPVYVDNKKMAVLFLDTEGLGSVKASATHDAEHL